MGLANMSAHNEQQSIIAGALFDLMGYLTCREKKLHLSASDDAAPAVEALTEWAEERGFDLDKARVTDWQAALAAQPSPVVKQNLTTQPAAAQEAVAYLDIGAGGYLDIGSDLPEEQLLALPNGRHALGIIGTYGIDGYVSAPVTAAPAGDDGKPMVLVSQEFKAQAEYDAQISSEASNLLRDNSLGLTGSLPAMVGELLKLASTPAAPAYIAVRVEGIGTAHLPLVDGGVDIPAMTIQHMAKHLSEAIT